MNERVVGPLRREREELLGGLSVVRDAARALAAGELTPADLDTALVWLESTFLATSRAEEFTLFPAVDGATGVAGATDVMVAQHASLAAMASDLAKVAAAARSAGVTEPFAAPLGALVHGLYAAVRVHLEAETGAYLPLLDAVLSESQVRVLVENLSRMRAGSAPPAPV